MAAAAGRAGAAAVGRVGGGLDMRSRERDPDRAFSLGGESDMTDGDTVLGSEMSALDDVGSEMSALDAAEGKEGESDVGGGIGGAGPAGAGAGAGPARGRSPSRATESAGGDAVREGRGSRGSNEAGQQRGSTGGGEFGGPVGATGNGNTDEETPTAREAAAAAATGRSTASSGARASAPASLGPGASAREEGWSDRDLLVGLMQPEDTPVVAAHDVSRSFGGVVVKRGLLLVCRSAVYFVDGFGIEPALPRPDAGPRSPAAAAVAASLAAAASRSKDPLHNVRRLEEWELGGGAGGIGGGDDDGDVCGARIRVMLRRRSQRDIGSSTTGSGAIKGGGTALTAEQVGGAGGGGGGRYGGARGGEAVENDDILAVGRYGVQRFSLDRLHSVYKRRYQLRDCGLEIFDVLGRSILVSFSTREQQEEVLTLLLVRGLPASIFSKGK